MATTSLAMAPPRGRAELAALPDGSDKIRPRESEDAEVGDSAPSPGEPATE